MTEKKVVSDKSFDALKEILLEKYKEQDSYQQISYSNVIETVHSEIAQIFSALTND